MSCNTPSLQMNGIPVENQESCTAKLKNLYDFLQWSFFHDFTRKHWINSWQKSSDQLNLRIFLRKKKKVDIKLFFSFLVSSLIFRNCLGAKRLEFNSIVNRIFCFVKTEWLWAIFFSQWKSVGKLLFRDDSFKRCSGIFRKINNFLGYFMERNFWGNFSPQFQIPLNYWYEAIYFNFLWMKDVVETMAKKIINFLVFCVCFQSWKIFHGFYLQSCDKALKALYFFQFIISIFYGSFISRNVTKNYSFNFNKSFN